MSIDVSDGPSGRSAPSRGFRIAYLGVAPGGLRPLG